MHPIASGPGLPLIIVVEGEYDVQFLTVISAILHRADSTIPDLTSLIAQRRAVFLTTGGSNIKSWIARVATFSKRTFYLFDRELEPETTQRRHAIQAVNQFPACRAFITGKRSIENYLHPNAIKEVTGIELSFDYNTDVASLLALKLMIRGGEPFWKQLPAKRQKRLREKAKHLLNVKAAQRMTLALLTEQDPHGDVIGWLHAIGQLVAMKDAAISLFSDRELATVLASLRHWQKDLSNNDLLTSEHFSEHSPLTVAEIDNLCEQLN